MNKRNKTINIIIIIFIAIIVLCTYFSKTIKNMLLPEVSVVALKSGTIGNNYQTEGTIKYANTHKVYAMNNWNVKEVLVKINQDVKKGDVLAKVDNDAITLSEREENAAIINLQNQIDALKKLPNPDQNKLKEYQFQLDTENMKYKQIRKGLTSDGSILSDIDGKIVAVNSQNGTQNPSSNKASLNSASASAVASGNSLFEIAGSQPDFLVNWTNNSNDAKNISVGDKVNIITSSSDSNNSAKELTANVLQKQYNDQTNQYEFSASIDGKPNLKEDDNVIISTADNTKRYDNVIPKSCLTEENGLDYIFVVNQKGGALGFYDYVQKVQVQVVASDDENCSIKPENEGSLPSDNLGIVMSTSKAIDDNSEVKLDTGN